MTSSEKSSQHFSLHWDKCQESLQASFEKLLNAEHFVDVSLAVEMEVIKCHKVVLSACSAYFEKILIDNPCQHPVIIMRGMKTWEVSALVDFMYKGEVNIKEECLDQLLKAAEALQIRGLAVNNEWTEKDPLDFEEAFLPKMSDISVNKPKNVYIKPKPKKRRANYFAKMLNDEVELKSWSDSNSSQLFTVEDKSDSGSNVSSLKIAVGDLKDEVKPLTDLDKSTMESNTSQKNIMIKEEVHMEFVNADDLSFDNGLQYENFEDDLSSEGNHIQTSVLEPGPSHPLLNAEQTSKEHCQKIGLAQMKSGRKLKTDWPIRLTTDTHFPVFIPSTLKKTNPTRICHVCAHTTRKARKRRESRYMCLECKVTLCMVPCFQDYHTLLNY